ncbi:MAG: AAA family ATPase [Minisyncoccia bacterium]
MYLKSIELSGFKSFAKKAELSFNSKVSAIVGPNGSGKSNIAEAFRFVLGEQSIKSLRGKKGEDLIFNGAGNLPRSNRAGVKVVFDNNTKFLPIDFETVTIERVVHRDSVNEYLINGSQVRLRDVIELLSSAHIGSSGHHIISQGEADRILNASTKERKAMIEDALGLKLYQYKKVESERKLEKTEENIKQVGSLRREIMPHIKFLKKQVEKVERAIELKDELQKEAQEYLRREEEYISVNEKNLEKEKNPLLESQSNLDKELRQAKETLEKAKNKDEKSKELIELESDLHNTREEKDSLYREFGRVDGELMSLIRMVKKQEEVGRSIEHKTVALILVEKLISDIEKITSEARQKKDVDYLVTAIDKTILLLNNFIDENKDRVDMSLLEESRKEIDSLKSRKEKIEKSLSDLTEKEKEFDKRYRELKSSIEKEKDVNRDAEKAVFRIMAESQEVRSKIHDLSLKEENLRLVREDFKRELLELGHIVGVSISEYKKLDLDFSVEERRGDQEERRRKIEKIKIRLEDSGGAGGAEVLKEYTEATERDSFLERELLDLEKSAESLQELIKDLDERLSNEFKQGISKINHQFKEYFSLMFGGGDASLSVSAPVKRKKRDTDLDLESGDDPELVEEEAEEGIDIEVNLPKKKVKGLMMLSGGERALTSIALLFAISQVNPPPFIILDETDAALDEANSKKYGDMVESLSERSQLIVITHNRETMSRAGILYGVTMGLGGGSKLLSVSFDEAVTTAK